MSTVGEAIEALNSQLHKKNFHATMVNMMNVPKGTDEEDNTMHDLMVQTYDWRYAGVVKGHELPSDDEVFHVNLTAANMRYIGRALEVYHRIHFEIYMKPILENMIQKMGDIGNEQDE